MSNPVPFNTERRNFPFSVVPPVRAALPVHHRLVAALPVRHRCHPYSSRAGPPRCFVRSRLTCRAPKGATHTHLKMLPLFALVVVASVDRV
ncbi:hypothetical protein SESBI_51310 [Sesbania bispinosa]|nr:hypothetical protein SESBI_51310 [Sesbania bispinosa]